MERSPGFKGSGRAHGFMTLHFSALNVALHYHTSGLYLAMLYKVLLHYHIESKSKTGQSYQPSFDAKKRIGISSAWILISIHMFTIPPSYTPQADNLHALNHSAMRLRLDIQRHGLPLVGILWPIRDDQAQSISTAQLLEQVNDIIPLESEDWGLEDYVVRVNGFECLHFSPLGEIIKDEDVVK